MPQLSPMKWFFLYILIISILMMMLSKLNFFFKKNLIEKKHPNKSLINFKFKW
uniref:ATP synthase F0 subunit 8 n=1 Tax=Dolichovespula xanthicincta TaxID=2982222 RepID=A0A977SPK6_9HYME|nr:ATP synthase F0 subunit 8 [Dolichovespula xanthicincta]